MARDVKDNAKKLSKSLSFEEKYSLASLKKELNETSVSRNRAQTYKQTSKRQAPIPTINVTNVKEKGKITWNITFLNKFWLKKLQKR